MDLKGVILREKKTISKVIDYHSTQTVLLKWQNYRDKQTSGCQGWRRQEGEDVAVAIKDSARDPHDKSALYLLTGVAKTIYKTDRNVQMPTHAHTHTNNCMENWWNLNKVNGVYQGQFSGYDIL